MTQSNRFTVFDGIDEFHRKFGFEMPPEPTLQNREMLRFRLSLLFEELMETAEAAGFMLAPSDNSHDSGPFPFKWVEAPQIDQSIPKFVDGLADLMYVVIGTAWLTNMPLEGAWELVHRANMLKERSEGKEDTRSVRQSPYDVVKPKGWTPPDIVGLLEGPFAGY